MPLAAILESSMKLHRRIAMDVSHLPTHAFGARDIMAWGTTGFVVIEGFTLVLCAVVYVYLRKNFSEWPPAGTMRPDVVVPTIFAVLMVLSLGIMKWLDEVAHRYDLAKVRLGLTLAACICAVFVGLRVWELTQSLNVWWDANAYGSAQWLVVGAHGSLLAIQLVEVAGMAAIFWLGPVERKHFSDASDIAYYWMFIVASWIPLYVMCFLLPHWI